ncbi:hypothetical protein [Rubellimicrobium aerolatum]|uniref:Uncharacterized protein n=1 Tax=Rubellimicrobium aerolatum TaxID=490979 RepID=A0ABW0S7Y6_9RHOB|nr:hypothetical protein [Rubellimicrobium aerolatum]MBP1804424.1 hypothetical protein [Rubellimicrobium aerolatum]
MRRAAPAALAALVALATPAQAQDRSEPLSAIDWLSRSVEDTPAPIVAPRPAEPPVASRAEPPGVTVAPLDGAQPATGILPPDVTGLPADLWSRSDPVTLIQLIRAEQVETLPALQDLLVTLMLAEAAPPAGDGGGALFLARVDKLLDMGALEGAQSLLESGDLLDPQVFRRWFDASLLRGTEAEACELLREHSSLAPTLPARVFCLARNGDWNAAVLTLNGARALGDVTPDDDALLTRFLDPELAEPDGLPPPSRPSPLVYRLREAVGDLMPTTGLPLAFSHADLRDTVAWRAQIEAAERLARHDALSENVLLGIYTARAPAASGGVWDRAAAVQALDAAILSGDRAAVAAALGPAWAALGPVALEVPLARLFGGDLLKLRLDGPAGALAHRVALLSPAYEAAARTREPASAQERIWRAVATGETEGVEGVDARSSAVLAGFGGAAPSSALAETLAGGRVGEALLRAIAAFQQGLDGDHQAAAEAIAALRAAGLEDYARRAALQFLLLEDRA